MDIYSLLAILVIAVLVIAVVWMFLRSGYRNLDLNVKIKDLIDIALKAKK